MVACLRGGALNCGAALLVLAAPFAVLAQSSPVKPGLWDTQSSVNRTMQLPPDVEAKIAAMPAAQQAQVRSMMGGSMGGGAPVSTSRQVCYAPQTSMDSLLSQAQQSPGMQCTFSNRAQNAGGGSVDISCTGQMGTAKGHTEFKLADEEHWSSTTHMTMTGTSNGHTMNSTIDATTTGKFVSADCGDVKPYTPPAK